MATPHRSDDLIAEARAYIAAGVAKTPRHGFAIIADLADALEVAEARATEAEASIEQQANECFNHMVRRESERDAALAVIENVRGLVEMWEWIPERGDVLEALSSVPADVLRERDRQVAERAWDEGARWAAVECAAIDDERQAWITPGDNPYRIEQNSEGNET